jgi:hypothetical protein
LKEGDEIIIRVKNTNIASPPKEVKIIDSEIDNQRKLKNYYAMKNSLEKEGLI